jgi:hypothetical protein
LAFRQSKFNTGPARNAVTLTGGDQALETETIGLIVGTAGDLDCTMASGERLTIPVPVGIIPISITNVHGLATTAGGMTALY